MTPEARGGSRARWLVWFAIAVIYVVWGSTYLAIAVTVQTVPSFLAAAARFALAGGALALWLAIRDRRALLGVTRTELAGCAVVGVALLLLGNGLVMTAERDVPSGLTALIVGSVPLWVLVLRSLAGERISLLALAGIVLGFTGVAVLVVPRGLSGSVAPLGMLLLLIASASWAAGSFASRRLALPSDQLVSTAYQMLFAAGGLLLTAIVAGDVAHFDPAAVSAESWVALGYLVVFGSILAFTAYTWLLQHAPISQVSTYAYVNPVVAVVLGALLLNEEITASILVGAALIVVSVAFVVWRESASAPADGAQRATGTLAADRYRAR